MALLLNYYLLNLLFPFYNLLLFFFIVNINNTRKNKSLRIEKLHNQILEAANEYPDLYNEYRLKVYKNRKIIK